MQSVTHLSEKSSKSKDKAKQLRSTIDASIKTLADAIDEVRASQQFIEYLDFQALFHDYSWHNCMLIMSQCPQASHVCGFKTWEKVDRHVCKGQRGIMIFAPRTFKKEIEKSNGDTEERIGITFRPVHVFDVSQTDGKDFPTFDATDVESIADGLLSDLVQVTKQRGIALSFNSIEGGAYGVSRKGKIEIDPEYSSGQQAKTLAHELAHEAIHWKKQDQADRGPLTRSIAELEAESVAYVVCKHFGLDTSVRSSRYIAIWKGDVKSLKSSLDLIAKTSRSIIDDISSATQSKAVA